MSNFSTKGVQVVESGSNGGSKYLSYGVQEAAIVGFELKKSSKSDKQLVVMLLESPKVVDAGFEPDEKSKFGGRVGRLNFSIYFGKDDKTQMDQFISDIALIAKKLDVSEKVDAIEADNVEDYLNKLMPIIRGKFATWAITAEEYVYVKDGADKIGYSLGKRRYGFIASNEEMKANPSHIKPFDKTNKYDYKPVAVASVDPDFVQAPEDEMPW